jgi:hypothetical protein
MRRTVEDLLLFLLASPILFVRWVFRMWRHFQFLRAATAAAVVCECGRPISLVGQWKCPCGFTYRGHLLSICPVCGRLPVIVRCYACGLTTKLPEPYASNY